MSKCGGIHCPGCKDGGGGGLVVLVAVVILAAIVARPVMHAAGVVLHVVLIVLEVAAITAGASALGYVTWRVHRSRAVRAAERPPAVSVRSSRPVAGRPATPIVARRVRRIGPQNREQYVYQVTTKEQK